MPLLSHIPDAQRGQALKRWRASRGLKAVDFATMTGISQSYVSEMEHGKRPITDEIGNRISQSFGMIIPDLEREIESHIPEKPTTLEKYTSVVLEDPVSYRTKPNKPPPPDGLALIGQWYLSKLSNTDAVALATKFMEDFQTGDETGLPKAQAILQFIASARS